MQPARIGPLQAQNNYLTCPRALANDPPLLLVDEPTGNLDTKTSLKVIQMLQKLKHDGKTVIVATHDERILALAEQKLLLEDGRLVSLE
jgi:ABC-type lipoprotein export system ATPase subunit